MPAQLALDFSRYLTSPQEGVLVRYFSEADLLRDLTDDELEELGRQLADADNKG